MFKITTVGVSDAEIRGLEEAAKICRHAEIEPGEDALAARKWACVTLDDIIKRAKDKRNFNEAMAKE